MGPQEYLEFWRKILVGSIGIVGLSLVSVENFLQLFSQRISGVQADEALIEPRFLKHVAAGLFVEVHQIVDGHAAGETSGNDGAGAGSAM